MQPRGRSGEPERDAPPARATRAATTRPGGPRVRGRFAHGGAVRAEPPSGPPGDPPPREDRRAARAVEDVPDTRVRVLCVEDNAAVAEAIRLKLEREGDFHWRGSLPTAAGLLEAVVRERPAVVLLDLDMPGPDPIAALQELARAHPASRALIFSGHVRLDLIERALEAGAWGYVSKNDGERSLVSCLRRVVQGEFVLSPEVRAVYGG